MYVFLDPSPSIIGPVVGGVVGGLVAVAVVIVIIVVAVVVCKKKEGTINTEIFVIA